MASAYPCTKTTLFECMDCETRFVIPYGCPANHFYSCPACNSKDTLHMGRSSLDAIEKGLVLVLDDEHLKMPPQYHDNLVPVRDPWESDASFKKRIGGPDAS